MADPNRPPPPPLLPDQGKFWSRNRKSAMPSTMKSYSIEEELMGDVWERAPPDADSEMGFFEVPRHQSIPTSTTTQLNSATVFTPPRRDLKGSSSNAASSSSSSTGAASRSSSTNPTIAGSTTSSSSSSSHAARSGSSSSTSFADRFSQWPRGPSIPPRSSSSRNKPQPSSSSSPKVPGSRNLLNPYSSNFQRTLPPPSPSAAQASHSSGNLPLRTGWTSHSTASTDSRLSTYSDPGNYHYFNPALSNTSLNSSIASSSTSSLELPKIRMSTYSIPERTSSIPSTHSDVSSPATPTRKRSSSSLFDRAESSSRSIRSIASTDGYGASFTTRRGSAQSEVDEPGLPLGWSGPEPVAESSSRRDSDSRQSSRGVEGGVGRMSHEDGGDRSYVLTVVQEPRLACAIGFEDDDEQPLSPTPILKLSVFDSQQRPLDPKTIDIHQLVVSIDLWAPDASHEMNLLVTPAGTTPSSRGRRGVSRDDESVSPSSRPLSPDPARIERERTPQPRQHDSPPIPRGWSQEGEVETRRASPPRTDWSNSSLPGIASFSRNSSLSSTADPSFPPSKDLPLAIPSSVSSAWDRRDSTSSTISSWSSTDPSPSARESIDSRWSGAGGEAYRQQHDPFRRSGLGAETFPPPPSDRPSSRHSASSSSLALPIEALSHIRLSSPSLSHSSPSFAAPALSHSASNPNFGGGGGVFSMAPRTLPPLPPPPVSGKYTRALVGSLVTVAHRLVDEKGETGIFFLANEVSVRTEGFYRLRFCLMQVDNSARIAPSLILAETFSSPFQVHPESTYPGPSPITRLSEIFLSQGVKLSLTGSRRQISEGIQVETMKDRGGRGDP